MRVIFSQNLENFLVGNKKRVVPFSHLTHAISQNHNVPYRVLSAKFDKNYNNVSSVDQIKIYCGHQAPR